MTCSRARRETKLSATLEGCAIGSSSCQMSFGSASRNCCCETTISWWSVPNARAASLANSSSFASRSSNATENVLIGSLTIPLINAAIADESIPPDRNMPSGTSDIRRSRTDVRNSSRHSSMYSASRFAGPPSAPAAACGGTSQ